MPALRHPTLLVALVTAACLACSDNPTAPRESAACNTTVGSIAVGDTVTGVLTTESCRLSDRTYADRWRFTLATATIVTIDLMSTDFDAWLIVRAADGTEVVHDDDGGAEQDARITIGLVAGEYFILANVYDANVTGAYTLAVQ